MKAADLIKKFEGCKLTAYQDTRGIWTVGYGCTGSGIVAGTVWTQAQADEALEHRLNAVISVIASLCHTPVSDQEMAAMCSLAWNIGTHAFSGCQVLRHLNANDVTGAANAFLNWTRAGNDPDILKPRREAERRFFLTGEL